MLGYYNYYKLVTLSRILSLTQLYKFHKHLRTEAAFVGGLTDGLHVPREGCRVYATFHHDTAT